MFNETTWLNPVGNPVGTAPADPTINPADSRCQPGWHPVFEPTAPPQPGELRNDSMPLYHCVNNQTGAINYPTPVLPGAPPSTTIGTTTGSLFGGLSTTTLLLIAGAIFFFMKR